jgi:raffinose/stachyose/melibiose transport system permease protein
MNSSSNIQDHALWSRIVQYIVVLCFLVVCIFPLAWLFMTALKTNQGFLDSPWRLPELPQWGNFAKAWSVGGIQKYFLNSVIVVGTSIIVMLVVCLPAAFGLVRLKFKLQKPLMSIVLFGLMIPGHSVVVPLFQTLNTLKIRGTLLAMILPYTAFAIPMAILILSGRLRTISREMEEAAVMDGCGVIGMFTKIIVPLLRAETVTVIIINFIWMWNELFFAMVFTSSDKLRTLPFGLLNFVGQYGTNWTIMFTAMIISFLPLFVLYLILQKYIIGGMTAGAVKG